MKVHTLDIDSGERDTHVYPYSNAYTVTLKNPIYNVTNITLVSARIPTPQLTTCATNKSFSVDGVTISLDETNYSNGTILASDLDVKLQPPISNVDSVVFDTDTDALTFSNTTSGGNFTFEFFDGTQGYSSNIALTTPHQVMGFSSQNQSSSNYTLTSGAINLDGPNSLIMKLTSGSDEFTKSVYSTTPFYTGHILLNGSDVINYHGADDPLKHEFYSGPQKYISDIHIEFFYMSHGRLIPYDFRHQDHILKFEITGSTDKLESLPKVPIPKEEGVDAPSISIPEGEVNAYKWKEYLSIGIIVLVGIILMSLVRRKPKLSE
jgi:hypothetical protein